MFRRRTLLPALVALTLSLIAPGPAYSADWDSFVELPPGEHVAVKRRFDGSKYDKVRSCFRDFKSRVGAEYYAMMVDVTAESGSRSRKHSDADAFAEALYEHWQKQRRLDGKDDILLVLGVHNRSLGVKVGSKWEHLGFRGQVIDETLEASLVHELQRKWQFNAALCSVISDIDLKLLRLQREMQERVSALKGRLPELDEKLSALHAEGNKRFDADHPYGKDVLSRLETARGHLEEAKAVAEDDPTRAVRLADRAEAALQPVREDIDAFTQKTSRLAALDEELAALRSTIAQRPDADWDEPRAALAALETCEAKLAEIRQSYEGDPARIGECIDRAQTRLAKADVHYFYRRSALPAAAIVLLLLLAAGLVYAQRRRRSRALAQLQPRMIEWRRRLGEAAKRLDELQLASPTYFDSERDAWQGESADVDRHVAAPINRMALLIAEANAVLDQAEIQRQKSHPLDARRLEAALETLRETTIVVEAGCIDERQPLPHPLPERYQAEAIEVLGDIEDAYQQAKVAMADIVALQDRLADQKTRAGEALFRTTRGVDRRREFGLSADHLTGPLERGANLWRDAQALSSRDPRRAADLFERSASELGSIAELADAGNTVVATVQGPLAELGDEMEQTLRQFRFARVDLDTLSFDPKLELEAAKRRAVRIVELVSRAREEDAQLELEALRRDMQRLARRVKTVDELRESLDERIDELGQRAVATKDGLLSTRFEMQSLPSQNPDAYGMELKWIRKYQSQINRVGRQLERARQKHAEGRYLAANDRLDAVGALLDDAEWLLDELGPIGERVHEARARSQRLLAECEPRMKRLERHMQRPKIDDRLRSVFTEQQVTYAMARDQVRSETGNWLVLYKELESLAEITAFLVDEFDGGLGDAPEERAYREALLAALTGDGVRNDYKTLSTLGDQSSWADAVSTADEVA